MKILFGVFDWGLGHATRDTPLIKELLKKNKVDIISTGRALKILKSTFGRKCRYYDVPSIHSPYTKTSFFVVSFISSIPKMLLSIKRARELTKKIIEKEKYDLVISDCRYDVYDKKENSYLINHQLKFAAPPILELIMKTYLSSQMSNYSTVIVPDFPSSPLTGKLSKNNLYKGKVKYIGTISFLKKKSLKEDIDYFVSLSGPEPQRTILEKKIIKQLKYLNGKIVIAGGNPDAEKQKDIRGVKFYSFLNAKKQENMMNRSKFIITRSGYTTIMDLVELDKKKVIVIPTPGQTEQEYLGEIYEKSRIFHHVPQSKLNLKKDVAETKNFKGFKPKWKTSKSVAKFMEIIND